MKVGLDWFCIGTFKLGTVFFFTILIKIATHSYFFVQAPFSDVKVSAYADDVGATDTVDIGASSDVGVDDALGGFGI